MQDFQIQMTRVFGLELGYTCLCVADAGLTLYRDYTAEELAVFYPASNLFLKTFDSNGVRKHFTL